MSEERIGVYVCNCGTNIAKVVDVEAVAAWAATVPGVAVARSYKYMCSNPGQEMVLNDIAEHGLTRVVVASCSPRMHEATFRGAIKRAGLNPYMLEMANIREHCSWIHDDTVAATEKAKALVPAAVQRVKFNEPLESRVAPMCPSTLVLGGGVTGLTAALELADAGQQVFLVEKQDHLGGNVARLDLTAPYLDSAQDILHGWISRVERHPNIRLFLNSEPTGLTGFNGNFKPTLKTEDGESLELDAGSILVCTGYKEFDASRIEQYGYGRLPDVITSFELEAMMRAGQLATKSGKTPRYVSIIHCVGSRSTQFHSYCSRVCCTTALKYAFEVKSAMPEVHVSNLYTDMETFGKGCEDFYRRCAEAKTSFVMYAKNQLPTIREAGAGDGCGMLITVKEQLTGEEIELPSDLVVLMVSMEPREDAAETRGWSISVAIRKAGTSRAILSWTRWRLRQTEFTLPAPASFRETSPSRSCRAGPRWRASWRRWPRERSTSTRSTRRYRISCAQGAALVCPFVLTAPLNCWRINMSATSSARSVRPADAAQRPVLRAPSKCGTIPTNRSTPRSRASCEQRYPAREGCGSDPGSVLGAVSEKPVYCTIRNSFNP